MPKDGLDRLRSLSAIYFGAVGALDVPDDIDLLALPSSPTPQEIIALSLWLPQFREP